MWFLGWDTVETKAFRFAGRKKKKKTQHSSPMSVTCGEVSSFGFDFLLRRRRHVCSDAESAARRNRSACQNKSPLYSAWNCGLHFSLDRQRGFFPEHCLETVRGDVTRSREERADVGRSRRVACSLNMGIWCRWNVLIFFELLIKNNNNTVFHILDESWYSVHYIVFIKKCHYYSMCIIVIIVCYQCYLKKKIIIKITKSWTYVHKEHTTNCQ